MGKALLPEAIMANPDAILGVYRLRHWKQISGNGRKRLRGREEKLVSSDGVGVYSTRLSVPIGSCERLELLGPNHEIEQGQPRGAHLSRATVRDEIHPGRFVAATQTAARIQVRDRWVSRHN